MATQSTPLYPGSYVLENLYYVPPDGTGIVDLRPQIENFTIYESIYNPYITGKLTFIDTFDLPNKRFSSPGFDLIYLSVYNPILGDTVKLEGLFHIYKVESQELMRVNSQTYTFQITAVESMIAQNTKISRRFKGASHEVVRQIYDDYISDPDSDSNKALITQESAVNVNYVSNYWNLSRNFSYLMKNAQTADGNSSFLFFENRNGFIFAPVEALSQQPSIQKFIADDYKADIKTDVSGYNARFGEVIQNLAREYNKVLGDYYIPEPMNYTALSRTGGISSTMTLVDLTKKRVDQVTYKWDNQTRLNQNPLFSKMAMNDTAPMHFIQTKQYGRFNNDSSNSDAPWIQKRLSTLKMLNGSRVEISVYGRLDYTAGKVVELVIPSVDPFAPDPYDNDYTGKYIISAIAHHFSQNSHECTIELSKESK